MIILASKSSRREELLKRIGLSDFKIMPADIGEDFSPEGHPADIVREISRRKAEAAKAKAYEDDIIIGADTLVYIDGVFLGKPQDETDAYKMLSLLSGNRHMVYTGVTVMRGDSVITEYEATTVQFRELASDEIEAYIETGEPADKAGAYGAQGIGALLISRIEGDFYNVMGLPVSRLCGMLKSVGVELLKKNAAP